MKKFLLIIVIFCFTFFTTACEEEPDPTLCECDPKNHLGIGEQAGSCADICDCTEQVVMLDGTAIKIRKQSGVTVAQMNSTVVILNYIYYYTFDMSMKDNFKANLVEIHLGPAGTPISHNPTTKVLTIGWDATDSEVAVWLFTNDLLSQLKQFDNSKNTVRLA